MNDRLATAQAALDAGRPAEAIEHLLAALAEDPARPAQVYRVLLTQLYQAGRHEEGAAWAAQAVAQHPRDVELANLRGVLLRRLGRHVEALAALDEAVRIAPQLNAPQFNRCNVLLDLKDGAKAEEGLTRLLRQQPRNAEAQRLLGRALRLQHKSDQALVRFRQAVAIQKDLVDAWLDLSGMLSDLHRIKQAEDVLEKALAANPGNPRLIEARAMLMRRAGQFRRAEAYLQELLAQQQDAAWLHHQLGLTLTELDRPRGNVHLRRAIELDPHNLDYLTVLIESLERTRTGDEGANIEEAYSLAEKALALDPKVADPWRKKVLYQILMRVCDYDAMPRVGDFRTRGRAWAENRLHTALLGQIGQVQTLEDRYELLEQHMIWGRETERRAAEAPIRRPPRAKSTGRIRLGFLSSDLRRHPVGYFALPLFEHVDERFEVFCYSFYEGQEDDIQQFITSKSAAFRWNREISARDAAQMIADDGLDMLIELGGSTHMNKLEVMAYRAAPQQASWLGYPHSAGLSTIDYLVVDPHNVPPRRDLLVEQPLMMPKTWIALGRMIFSDHHVIAPGLPQDRAGGVITFGTANNPHKYNPALFAAWAEVLRAVPGSRFMFIRPEGGAASFRRHVLAEFAKGGIAEDRIVFHAVRGQHMPHYNEVDITLDTFPLTGGTTTTEALWMGVPVISLVGEAFFERLSGSILANAGVADMATTDPARFTQIAVALAADRPRRLELRQGLREAMRSGPLGQTEQFARDFYDMVARAVEESPAKAAAKA